MDEMRKVNVFDWEKEFSEIFEVGGFDCVIGNPPWGAELSNQEKTFLSSFHDISLNTAYLLIEKGLHLLNDKGNLHYIIPKGLSYVPNLKSMRKFLIENYSIHLLIDTSEAFKASGVQLETMLICIGKNEVDNVLTGYNINNDFRTDYVTNNIALTEDVFSLWINSSNAKIVEKVKQDSFLLGDICTSKRGIGINKYVSNEKNGRIVLGGKTIFRYNIGFFTYVSSDYIQDKFSWQLTPKIMMQEIVGRVGKPLFGNFRKVKLNSTIDENGEFYTLDTVVNLFNFNENFNIKYVLALLNSKLVTWFFHIYQKNFSQLTLHSGNKNSRNIPILNISLKDQEKFIILVNQMRYVSR